MIINRDEIYEYPFEGRFFHVGIDETKPYDERTEEEITDLETACDIIEASSATKTEFIDAKWDVFFPINTDSSIAIKEGYSFDGAIYGLSVKGIILGLSPSQLGGCVAHIKDNTV